MYKYAAAIGADIGHLTIRVAVVRLDGEVIREESYPLNKDRNKTYIITGLLKAIKDIRQSVASDGLNPISIGVSAKGFIDHEKGIILGPDQGIKEWKNVTLARILYRETGLPAFIGNDANLMTIAEQRYGAANGFENVVFVALRTGIGGGIIINGKLYRGVNNAGGEIGQMIINFSGGESETGIRGSFEHFASSSALVRRYLEEKATGKKDSSGISAKDIFFMSYKKDPVAVKVVKENAYLVGIGIANLITIFAPEIIVLGGGMAQARDNYINMIRESAFKNSLENCRSEVKIERAALGPSAALIGAAYYSLTRLAGRKI
jgi:glucokinase